MKKALSGLVIILLIVGVCAFIVVGCGNTQEVVEEPEVNAPAETTSTPATTPAPVVTTPPPAPPVSTDVKNGFTESQRKSIFWDLIVAQDAGTPGDPQSDATAYAVVASKYNTDVWVVRDIGMEGISKNWPMPPSP